jgi:dihydropyrimidinase
MTRLDLSIEGADVHLPGLGLMPVNVGIRDGVIAALLPRSERLDADEHIDATGKVVLPGAIDAHVHLGADITVPKEAVEVASETRSAVLGGVTTVLGYLMSSAPYEDLFGPVLEVFESAAYSNFGLHFCIGTEHQLEMLPAYVKELGVPTFKFFMNFKGSEGEYLGLPGNDDSFLWRLLERAAPIGAMVNPHAENIELVWGRRSGAMAGAMTNPLRAWNASRPAIVEAEAESRVAMFAAQTGTSIYAVHVSSGLALEALVGRRAGQPGVFIETCPHYLVLDQDSPIGTYGKVNPPLRTAADREALWDGIACGAVDVVGSDHVPRHRSAKEKDIWKASAGFPGIETLLPLLLSEGHVKRGIPLSRIVDVVATRPAQLFGMYPRKGAVAVGADADLAVVDFGQQYTLSNETVASSAAYTPYAGMTMHCCVTDTVVGGRVVVRAGEVVAGPAGRYVHRSSSGTAALEAVTDGHQRAATRAGAMAGGGDPATIGGSR